jgi:hypothetical protein
MLISIYNLKVMYKYIIDLNAKKSSFKKSHSINGYIKYMVLVICQSDGGIHIPIKAYIRESDKYTYCHIEVNYRHYQFKASSAIEFCEILNSKIDEAILKAILNCGFTFDKELIIESKPINRLLMAMAEYMGINKCRILWENLQ